MTVAAILKHKGYDVAAVRPDVSIADVSRLLAGRRIGGVVVQDASERLLGILTERDIVHALSAHGVRTLDMTAAQLMTRGIQTATPQTTVEEAMQIMTTGRFRHLPVIEHDVLVGIISIGDVVKSLILEQKSVVDSLRAYVAGVG